MQENSRLSAGETIRPASDDDSSYLIEVISACFADYPGCVLDVDAEEPWLRRPATTYEQAGGRLWVVEVDGDVSACIGLKPVDESTAELKNLYVAHKARRRGLGARLAQLVEDEAITRGASAIVLWSDSRFTDAHRLYERLGYQRTGDTRDLHDLSDTTEFHFCKSLT